MSSMPLLVVSSNLVRILLWIFGFSVVDFQAQQEQGKDKDDICSQGKSQNRILSGQSSFRKSSGRSTVVDPMMLKRYGVEHLSVFVWVL
jgi:hypothetical protein